MRKLLLSLAVLAGAVLASPLPASATAATGLVQKPAITSEAEVEKVGWGHRRHRRFGFGIGFGRPYYYGYYPRYRYYNDYDYAPRHRYYRHNYRRHRYHNRHGHW